MILAGDVGGTKSRLALFEKKEETFIPKDSEIFVSQDFSSLEEVIRIFLDKHQKSVSKVCIGVPGPVTKGASKALNLHWTMQEDKIRETVGIEKVKLVNDLVAMTSAIPLLGEDDLWTLNPGEPSHNSATCAALAPGTGLGQAALFFDSNHHCHIVPSEGGHAGFSPFNEIETELLKFLQSKHGHVSFERILSGPGLLNIYHFLKETGRAKEPPELKSRMQNGNPAAVVSMTGQDEEFEICVKALDIFTSVLGSQAGNLVLTFIATGGIYLGGGIPPKIGKKLSDGTILDAYFNKGRLTDLVQKTPLHVIRDECAPLLGAASIASEL